MLYNKNHEIKEIGNIKIKYFDFSFSLISNIAKEKNKNKTQIKSLEKAAQIEKNIAAKTRFNDGRCSVVNTKYIVIKEKQLNKRSPLAAIQEEIGTKRELNEQNPINKSPKSG